jgi:hypothetical protein
LLFDKVPDWSGEQRSALQLNDAASHDTMPEMADADVVLVDATNLQPVATRLDVPPSEQRSISNNASAVQTKAGAGNRSAPSVKLAELDVPQSSMDPYKFMMILLMMITATAATISLMWFCARVFVM